MTYKMAEILAALEERVRSHAYHQVYKRGYLRALSDVRINMHDAPVQSAPSEEDAIAVIIDKVDADYAPLGTNAKAAIYDLISNALRAQLAIEHEIGEGYLERLRAADEGISKLQGYLDEECRLRREAEAKAERNEELEALVCDLIASDPEDLGPTCHYVTVRIDKADYEEARKIRAALSAQTPTPSSKNEGKKTEPQPSSFSC